MPSVAILAVEGCYVSCAAGFADVLQAANAHLRHRQGPDGRPFEWRFLSAGGGPVAASNGMRFETQPLRWRPRFDAVVIPAIHYPGFKPFVRFLDRQTATYDWLRAQWNAGAWIAANCTGTFVLAQSGLLDGRAATTTWWLDRQFRSRYPKVDVQFRSALTEADRLVCAGATATYLLQAVRMVDRFMGPTIASQCAKSMLIDVSHTGQIPYLPLLAETEHADSLVERAQDWLQKHMARDITMSDLARAVAASDRTLLRRFGAATGRTPLGYLQALRLQAARALLEAGDMPVQSIATQVGYSDASSFSRLFRQCMGLSPGAYRRRFQSPAPP
ncbi:MAG: helix-turn-helix domain-containing protein [Burkholderiales bacterium]|nr:helix-turn-helix domain-containing protein [Burkholderiales bacterium]